MEFIGELERVFAASIYPNRVAIAVGAAALLAVVGMVAWRRGWHRAASRHPRRVAALLVPALLVGLPLGWYVGSPLVVSNTVDEPAPVIGGPAPVASPGAPQPTVEPSSTASPPESQEPAAPAPAERTGAFEGADEFHFGRGTARLIETAPGNWTVRLEAFEVRNGPDLFVYLSPSADGYADGAVELGALKADRGNQNYEVPAETDVAAARSVVIWCRQFAVLFATAPLAGG